MTRPIDGPLGYWDAADREYQRRQSAVSNSVELMAMSENQGRRGFATGWERIRDLGHEALSAWYEREGARADFRAASGA